MILIKSNIINHFKQMDFIVILFMMLLVKKPCFCNNESVFYNSSRSSNKFKSFYSSLCSLFSNFIKCIIFFKDYFHTFESFPYFQIISTLSKFIMWFKLKPKVFFSNISSLCSGLAKWFLSFKIHHAIQVKAQV